MGITTIEAGKRDTTSHRTAWPLLYQRRFWLLPTAMLVFLLPMVLVLAFAPLAIREPISGLGQFLGMLVAVCSTVVVGRRTPHGQLRQAWRLIALALLAYLIASGIIIYIAIATPTPTATASVADAFFLPFYPLLAWGVIRLPTTISQGTERVRSLLDAGIIVIALLSIGLVFLIAPRFQSGTTVDFVFIAYPIGDFILLLVLVILLLRGTQDSFRPVLFWLALGMLSFIYADSAFNFLDLTVPNYGGGTPLVDPFWIIGGFSFALAALYSLVHGNEPLGPGWKWLGGFNVARNARLGSTNTLNTIVLLYAPVCILFGLLAVQVLEPQTRAPVFLAVLAMTFIEIVLIITRQILTARDLVNAQIAIEQARQLDDLKDQFITSVNHELRTPIMTMQGYIDILDEMHEDIAQTKRSEMLGRARRANTALVTLIQSILDTRRIDQEVQGIILEPVNVYETVMGALEMIDPREGAHGERNFILQVPRDLTVLSETVRLQQVFSNIIANGVKYSQPGTDIQMTARLVAGDRRLFSGGSTSPQVEIAFRDFGLGIPPEQIPLLFHRFVRLPRDLASRVRGTGLGLYLCRLFIEAMNGKIWVDSQGIAGEGSTFFIRLPVPQ